MDIYSLEQILAANLSWNRARIKFLARFLIALFQVQTVNLTSDCLRVFGTREDFVQLQTHAKILAFFLISQVEMARLMLKLLELVPPFVIAIDRTEWQLGKSRVNVLLLSVSYKRVAIPLFWTVWEEKGCSDNQERCEIVERFIEEFGIESLRFARGGSGIRLQTVA